MNKKKKLTVASHGRKGSRSCVPVEDFVTALKAEVDEGLP